MNDSAGPIVLLLLLTGLVIWAAWFRLVTMLFEWAAAP